MIKRFIVAFLVFSIFCSSVFAANFTVKLERIYTSGDKMMISWEDGKKSALLVLVQKEDQAEINLNNHYKVGGMYPAYYTDNLYTQLIVYDDNGNPQKFIDDTNSRLLEETKQKAAQAQKEAQLKSDQEAPWVVLGIVAAILGGVLLFLAIQSSVSSSSSSTSK